VRKYDLGGHEGVVTGVSFNPDATVLASSGFDGKVRLWDMESGAQLSTLTNQDLPLEGADFSPNGRHVVTAGDDGTIRILISSFEELIETAKFRLSRDLTHTECQQYLHLEKCEEN
jgi:WD40 repeat protein